MDVESISPFVVYGSCQPEDIMSAECHDTDNVFFENGHDLLMNAPIGVYTSTPEGRFTAANICMARMFGFASPRELIDSVTDIGTQLYADPQDRERLKKALRDRTEVMNQEFQMVRRDGTVIWVSRSARVVRDEQGRVVYEGFVSDITGRREAEAARFKLSQNYQELVENINDVLFSTGQDGTIQYVSPRVVELLGFAPVEIVGRRYSEFVLAEDLPRLERAWGEIMAGRLESNEYRLVKKDGGMVWVRSSSRPIVHDGKAVGLRGVLVDITGLKMVEEALRKSEERFMLAMDAARDGIWDWNVGTGEVYYSPAYAEMLGYAADGIPAHVSSWMDLIHPEDGERALEANTNCIENRAESFEIEYRMRAKDGSWRWILGRGRAASRNKDGRATRMVGTHTDITERKRSEEAIVRAKERAEEATRAKSEFLANMSHEIRTPINGITGMMQLLQTTFLEDDQREYVNLAATAADRLTRLLTDILDLSRVEAGKMDLVEEAFEVGSIGESVVGLFAVTARSKGVVLEWTLDRALPGRLVGDEARLRQIVFNLVGNALKFTDQGSVKVEMDRLSPAKGNDLRVLVTVSDTGVGVAENRLEEIFQPFKQVEELYTRRHQGAGLGLSIVRRIVQLMGGSMAMESEVGKGSRVYVVLPFKLPTEASGQTGPESTRACRRMRILLAEDDLSNQIPTRKLLEKAGHRVAVAKDGRQVLEILAEDDFDCVLMDIQMPIMNGVEATRAIRSSDSLGSKRHIPIVALTAYAMKGDREKFLAAGMNGYLAKPVLMEDLAEVLAGLGGKTG
ncbi:MAG: PAS domain S-box protein [Deltaproteobacteria bacterium]|nr:PAS domain S-box protein [Deltaproteobacteria bacterium]